MLRITKLFILAQLVLCCTGCTALKTCAPCATGIQHVVFVWLKNPGDAAQRTAIIDASRELKKIPLVKQLQIGPMVPSDRPVVDSTFDIGISMLFENEGAMREYVVHPEHVRLVNEILKPHAARMAVYDFAIGY